MITPDLTKIIMEKNDYSAEVYSIEEIRNFKKSKTLCELEDRNVKVALLIEDSKMN